jgi:hypothetical protein
MGKYHSGKYKLKNKEKYRGDPNTITYRSSWELKWLIWLDTNPSVLEFSSEEIIVPYKSPVDGKWHRYFTDVFMKIQSKDGTIKTFLVEIKPYNQTIEPKPKKRVTKGYITEVTTWAVNQAKWKAAIEYCKDRKWEFIVMSSVDGISFKLLTESDLNLT